MIIRNSIVVPWCVGLIIFTTILTVGGLKCWSCSSQGVNGTLCSDPFDPDIAPGIFQNRETYVDCYLSHLDSSSTKRPACKKIELEIYGTILTQRGCTYEDVNDLPEKCYYDDVPAYFETVFCETCLTDGCNDASIFLPGQLISLTSLVGILASYRLF